MLSREQIERRARDCALLLATDHDFSDMAERINKFQCLIADCIKEFAALDGRLGQTDGAQRPADDSSPAIGHGGPDAANPSLPQAGAVAEGWFLPDEKINDLQRRSLETTVKRCKQAHFTNVTIRINGQWEESEADWIKHMVRTRPPAVTNADMLPCGHHPSLLVKSVESDYQFCELCECRRMRNDAEQMERVYKEKLEAVTNAAQPSAEGLKIVEEHEARWWKVRGDYIVGHKTFMNDDGLTFRHEPLTKGEADKIWAAVEAAKAKRAANMPTEKDAVNALWDAWYRLKELGWKEVTYAHELKQEGVEAQLIEAGSAGIHVGYYHAVDNNAVWWIGPEGCPSHPILVKHIDGKAEKWPRVTARTDPDEPAKRVCAPPAKD